ncbi:hypothetical protein NKG94_04065 [Micromonospora sp. M12]
MGGLVDLSGDDWDRLPAILAAAGHDDQYAVRPGGCSCPAWAGSPVTASPGPGHRAAPCW